jgi:hypothetical protein
LIRIRKDLERKIRIRRKSFNLTCEELSSGGRKVNPAQRKKMLIIYNPAILTHSLP